jgi:hypothetical protein
MKRIAYGILFIISLHQLSAQEKITIDLSENNTFTQSIKPGIYEIEIINMLGIENYNIRLISENLKIEPLSTPLIIVDKDILLERTKDSTCSDINNAINSLTDEKTLAETILNLQNKYDEKSNCYASLNELIEKTRTTKSITVDEGDYIEVIIERKIRNKSKKWHYKYLPPSNSKWVAHYGFSFIDKIGSREHTFFTKRIGVDTFSIQSENGRSTLLYVPTIFYSWLPSYSPNSSFDYSITGGLGFDLSAPTVYLGFSAFYHHNLGLSLGISAHKQKFLFGKYNEGDIIKENLNDSQLHDSQYTVNPTLSLIFKFDKNPSKSKSAIE